MTQPGGPNEPTFSVAQLQQLIDAGVLKMPGHAAAHGGTATPGTAPADAKDERLIELIATFTVLTKWFAEHVTDRTTAEHGVEVARKLLDDNLYLGAPSEATIQVAIKEAKEGHEEEKHSLKSKLLGMGKGVFFD